MDNSSSSNSSQHYSNLIGTVSELRADLERAVAKIHSLEDQNKSLLNTYQTIKEELVETRRKYHEVNQAYTKTVNEKFEAEKQNEIFMDKIRVQLSEKTREFEQIRDKYAPQDVDYIRIKVQEELEIPHRIRIQAMEAEVEKHKESYYGIRRDLERCKSEFEIYAQNQKITIHAQRNEYEGVIESLRNSIIELQNKQYSSEKEEQIRSLKVKLNESEHFYQAISNELKSIQRERDDLVYSQEQTKTRQYEHIVQLKTKVATLEAEKQATDYRINSLHADVEQKDILLRSARQVAEELGYEIKEMKLQIEEKEKMILELKEKENEKLDHEKLIYENDRNAYKMEADNLRNKLHDREELIRKLQRECSDYQLRAESYDVDIRKSYMTQIHDSKIKYEQLELKFNQLRASYQDLESKKNLESMNFINEKEYLQSELSRVNREKSILHDKLINIQSNIDTDKAKYKANLEELQSKLQDTEAKHQMVFHQFLQSEEKLKKIYEKHEESVRLISSYRQKEDLLKLEHSEQWSDLQQEIQSRYDKLGNAYIKKVEELKSKYQKSIHHEQRKSNRYKKKALELSDKLKSLTAAMSVASRDFPELIGLQQVETLA